jgi:hypothetical protein
VGQPLALALGYVARIKFKALSGRHEVNETLASWGAVGVQDVTADRISLPEAERELAKRAIL